MKELEKKSPGDAGEQRPPAEKKTERDTERNAVEQMKGGTGAVNEGRRGGAAGEENPERADRLLRVHR